MAKNIQADPIADLLKTIPKEHKKAVKKLMQISMERGRAEVLDLVRDLADIPIKKFTEYGIWHEDCLDGG
jgi:hypothetical protein